MTTQPELHDDMPSMPADVLEEVTELTGGEGGLWVVTTVSSSYHFDLENMLVTRIPGPFASVTVNDRTRPIARIKHCRVGSGGYWTMAPEGDLLQFVEFFWQACTTIISIQRVHAFDTTT